MGFEDGGKRYQEVESLHEHVNRSPEDELLMEEEEFGQVLYRAEFGKEDAYVNYVTLAWVLICVPFILIYGLGLIMLLYTPVFRYISRKDIQNRRLYITSENVVLKTNRPACCPCFGSNTSEKHVLLPLVTDVVVSQGWLEACFGLHTCTIENAGQGSMQGNKHGADLAVQGVTDPKVFKRVLLGAVRAKRAGGDFTKDNVQQLIETGRADTGTGGGYGGDAFSGMPGMPGGGFAQPNNQQLDRLNTTMASIETLLKEQNELLRVKIEGAQPQPQQPQQQQQQSVSIQSEEL